MNEPTHQQATRASYNSVAHEYARHTAGAPTHSLDRAMTSAFTAAVAPGLPVADVGCGPGHFTNELNLLGVNAFGIDLAPNMVAEARNSYPTLRFEEGSMTALAHKDKTLGGITARYSVIHLPPEMMPALFAEFHRVLAPQGLLLLVFQVGDECLRVTSAYGQQVSLDTYRLAPRTVAEWLRRAGFQIAAELVREPTSSEKGPQASLLARKPG